jgi:RNA polymerase primary sigma factor
MLAIQRPAQGLAALFGSSAGPSCWRRPSIDSPPTARKSSSAISSPPRPASKAPERDRIPAFPNPDRDSGQERRFPNREQEAHAFRKLNYLKFLACRIRDNIDQDYPVSGERDEVERLQTEALKLKNRIIETHLPLAVSVVKRRVRVGFDLSDRVSDATLALMHAGDRFDFARGNRFTTYATWAIINDLVRYDRRQRRCSSRAVSLNVDGLATEEPESVLYEREEAQDVCRAAVERLLRRLDGRERWIIVNRNGIGGVPEQTLSQIGLDLGISKERVRQIEERAHAKLRSFARLEAIEPSSC